MLQAKKIINTTYQKIKNNRTIILLFLIIILFSYQVRAQSSDFVSYHFKADTINIEGGKTFSNYLIIKNAALSTVGLVRNGVNVNLDNAILKLPDTMIIEAGQTKSFPLKYFSDEQTIQSNIQSFEVKLRSITRNINVQKSSSFYTQLLNVSGLVLDVQSSEIYFDPISNKADLQLRVFNSGLIPITFDLDLSGIPKGQEFLGTKGRMTLAAGTEKILPFVAINKSRNNAAADFLVTIKAVDQSGNQLSVRRLRIMTVSSNRNLVLNEQDIYYKTRPNTLSLNYMNANNFNSLQLFGNGKIDLKKETGTSLQFKS
ncbi:hypothetical protein TH53_00425 [Pedobacter lusitanus]|uniref:Uncharacterized protein n=1 Tax=Pedobacter lusitanus TaxID=1503925 RepID=A0A0D0GRW0_9SPHI|nr:hypothetical protein [Pedobacter lusitanus]KIO78990.1 hypothetical protein TH53_00425 [Pedobacter lusitanus]